jgi:hypothetical protein
MWGFDTHHSMAPRENLVFPALGCSAPMHRNALDACKIRHACIYNVIILDEKLKN